MKPETLKYLECPNATSLWLLGTMSSPARTMRSQSPRCTATFKLHGECLPWHMIDDRLEQQSKIQEFNPFSYDVPSAIGFLEPGGAN